VRGAGGWVVGPGSVRPDGARWEGAEGAPSLAEAFQSGAIPVLPEWVAAQIRDGPHASIHGPIGVKTSSHRSSSEDSGNGRYGRLAGWREADYAAAALAGCVDELVHALPGERNNKLNALSYRMGRMIVRRWIERAVVADALWSACETNGLVHEDGAAAVQATLASGIEAGLGEPHPELWNRSQSSGGGFATKGVRTDPIARGFRFHRIGDHDPLDGPRFLIPGFVPQSAVLFLTGKPGSRKSFLAIDWCCRITAGLPVAGKPTIPGATVYLVGEGQAGIARRVAAWVRANGIDGQTIPFRYCLRVPDIRNDGAIDTLIAAIQNATKDLDVPLVLVILDTFNKSLSGGSDTKAEDVAKALRGMERIRDELGCTVIAIHHPPRGNETRNRGLGMIDGDTDGTVLVDWDKATGIGTLTIDKLRESDENATLRFRTRRIPLGVHKIDGSGVGSLAIEYVDADDPGITAGPPRRFSRSDKVFADAFGEAKLNGGFGRAVMGDGPILQVVRLCEVRVEFLRRWATGNDDATTAAEARSKAFRRALRSAVASQGFATEVVDGEELIWQARQPGQRIGPTSGGTPDKTDTP